MEESSSRVASPDRDKIVPPTSRSAKATPVYFCKRNTRDIVKVMNNAGKREVEIITGTGPEPNNDGW